MKQISDVFSSTYQPISYEMFPPKGDLTLEQAREVVAGLAPCKPDFISVTYSAGGSGNSQATAQIAQMIQDEYDIPAVAHLTCINTTLRDIDGKIAEMRERGVRNVLALRGDRVPGAEATDFRYAKDLIPRLVDAGFCVGAAAYPEGHIECDDVRLSVEHLKEKQDAGASFLVTQLCFSNEELYRFRDRAARAGVTVPVTYGIMPFMSKQQLERMVFMCGASLPSPVIKLLARYEDDPVALRQAGMDYACRQIEDLVSHGVEGIHVYTMNRPDVARVCAGAVPRVPRG